MSTESAAANWDNVELLKERVHHYFLKVLRDGQLSFGEWSELNDALLFLGIHHAKQANERLGVGITEGLVERYKDLEEALKLDKFTSEQKAALDFHLMSKVRTRFGIEQREGEVVDFSKGAGPTLVAMLRHYEEVEYIPGSMIQEYKKAQKISERLKQFFRRKVSAGKKNREE